MPTRTRSNAPGHTGRAGYGNHHQQQRQRALKQLKDAGEGLCARCEARGIEHRMPGELVQVSADGKRLVSPWLDLDDFPGLRYGGPQAKRLSFKSCNRGDGARAATAIVTAKRRAEYSRW